MTIKYSRKRCRAFVNKARKLFDDTDFVRLWFLFTLIIPYLDDHSASRIFDDSDIALDLIGEKKLVLFMLREWTKLSLWEMQSVLYMFKPYITEIARKNAWTVLQHARKKRTFMNYDVIGVMYHRCTHACKGWFCGAKETPLYQEDLDKLLLFA